MYSQGGGHTNQTKCKVVHAQKVLAAVETLDMTTRPANCRKAFDYSAPVSIIEVLITPNPHADYSPKPR